MTTFRGTATLQDAYGRKTRKMFETVDISGADVGAEFLVANTAMAALMTDLAALTEAEILWFTCGLETTYTDTADAGANVDEGLTLVVDKADSKRGNLKVPAPINSVFNPDGTADITDAAITAYVANFQAGGDFLFSDGEEVANIISGRLDK